MKMIYYFAFLAISLLFFTDCKKEELGVSLDDMLSNGTWKSKQELVNGMLNYVYEEAYAETFTFSQDGTYISHTPISYLPFQAGTWNINPQDSIISFQTVFENGEGYDYSRKMKKLTNTEFILEQRHFDTNRNRWISMQTIFGH